MAWVEERVKTLIKWDNVLQHFEVMRSLCFHLNIIPDNYYKTFTATGRRETVWLGGRVFGSIQKYLKDPGYTQAPFQQK